MAEMPYNNNQEPTGEQLGIPTPPRPPMGTATPDAVAPTPVATPMPDQMQTVSTPREQTAVATRDWQAEINDLKSRMEEQKAQYIMQIEMLKAQLQAQQKPAPVQDVEAVQEVVTPMPTQPVQPPRQGPTADPRPAVTPMPAKPIMPMLPTLPVQPNPRTTGQLELLKKKLAEQRKTFGTMTPEQRRNFSANQSIQKIMSNTMLDPVEQRKRVRQVKLDLAHARQIEQMRKQNVPPTVIMDRSFRYNLQKARRNAVPNEQIRLMIMQHQHRKKMFRAQKAGVSRKELMNMQASFQVDVLNYKNRLAMATKKMDARTRNRDRYRSMYERWKQQRAQANRPRNVR